MGQKHAHHDEGKHDKAAAKAQAPHQNLIPDQIHSYEELQKALRASGLESSQLVIGIDYTVSNGWQGKKTFGGKSLHTIEFGKNNPYQQVIDIMGRTLEVFDDDHLVLILAH
eukprot:TRINITY_DN6146_c0_g1_i2.p2 TRINITY_DN6146_c0_g1~~TRINITY_DN6146_c0_g1_i2.p2  ORF type:complete len:112 (-),score=16.61 TRINITY_DN6146_c0_g1_i2:534-869(-)